MTSQSPYGPPVEMTPDEAAACWAKKAKVLIAELPDTSLLTISDKVMDEIVAVQGALSMKLGLAVRMRERRASV
jgi:hypothetical protein